MIIQAHFNRDFMRKKIFAGTAVRTHDRLTHVFMPRHYLPYITWICISPFDHFAPVGSQYTGAVTKTTIAASSNINQNLCI